MVLGQGHRDGDVAAVALDGGAVHAGLVKGLDARVLEGLVLDGLVGGDELAGFIAEAAEACRPMPSRARKGAASGARPEPLSKEGATLFFLSLC